MVIRVISSQQTSPTKKPSWPCWLVGDGLAMVIYSALIRSHQSTSLVRGSFGLVRPPRGYNARGALQPCLKMWSDIGRCYTPRPLRSRSLHSTDIQFPPVSMSIYGEPQPGFVARDGCPRPGPPEGHRRSSEPMGGALQESFLSLTCPSIHPHRRLRIS